MVTPERDVYRREIPERPAQQVCCPDSLVKSKKPIRRSDVNIYQAKEEHYRPGGRVQEGIRKVIFVLTNIADRQNRNRDQPPGYNTRNDPANE